MKDAVLVINSGSSSIKFGVYALSAAKPLMLLRGKITLIPRQPALTLYDEATDSWQADTSITFTDNASQQADHATILPQLITWLTDTQHGYRIAAVGHRVVHGGQHLTQPVKLTPAIMLELSTLVSLAPLHQPHNLKAIDVISQWNEHIPQIACFDTSFHSTQPEIATWFGLPRHLTEQGILRYGFHGLSYEYIAANLPHYLGERANGRIIVAHLGNGASMCALKSRRSVATSMGFTALDGLIMGQRCGALDAGVVLHLLQQHHLSPAAIEHMLYNESGLKGVSGISNNMQVLTTSTHPHAQQAIDLFCYRAARELSSLVCAIDGIDAIVFTAGIGEHSALVRERICGHLGWLGVALDPIANQHHHSVISPVKCPITTLVIPTDEESVIAQSTLALMYDSTDSKEIHHA